MKNFYYIILLVASILFAKNFSFSQSISIGPEQNIAYGFKEIFPVGENSFFVQHYDKMTGTKMILTHYSNFIKDATTGTITSDDCGVLVLDNKLVVFQNVTKNGIVTMTAQEYGTDCKPVGDSKALMSFKMVGTMPRERVFGSVVQSENGEYFASIFKIIYKDKEKFGFHIYDKSFKSIREGFFETPYDTYKISLPDKYLSNQGNLYISIDYKDKNIFNGVKKIWKLENNTMNEIEVKIDGFSIVNPMIYETKDGSLEFAVIGQEKESTELNLLIGTIDYTDNTVSLISKIELEKEFIGFNNLYSKYSIPKIVMFENGNMAMVIDQYTSSTITNNSNGVTTYSYSITYYDTKVLLLNKNNDLLWTANLGHANQVSYFGKYHSTWCLDVKDDELVFYMDLNKTRTGMEIPQTFTVSQDRQAEADNCLGMISVDMQTGDTKRELLCDQLGCNWVSYLTIDKYNKGVMVAFHKGIMKYRFGLLK